MLVTRYKVDSFFDSFIHYPTEICFVLYFFYLPCVRCVIGSGNVLWTKYMESLPLASMWRHLSMGLSNSEYLRICSVFWSPWLDLSWIWMALALIVMSVLILIMKVMIEVNLSFSAFLYWTLSLSSEIILSNLQDSKYMLTPWSIVSVILSVISLLSINSPTKSSSYHGIPSIYDPRGNLTFASPLIPVITVQCGVKRQPQVETYWIISKL